MMDNAQKYADLMVASFAEAWIEIEQLDGYTVFNYRRLLRGGVD